MRRDQNVIARPEGPKFATQLRRIRPDESAEHFGGQSHQRVRQRSLANFVATLLAMTMISASIFSVVWAQQEESASPIQVRFETVSVPQAPEAAFVHLIVERKLELLSLKTPAERSLELFLRLPQGVRLDSSDWEAAPPNPKEKKDSTGNWSLYERIVPIEKEVNGEPLVLARVPLSLSVIEDGTNWVITARARLIEPGKSWTAFGVIFASREGGRVKFHAAPQIPTQPNAQENRS